MIFGHESEMNLTLIENVYKKLADDVFTNGEQQHLLPIYGHSHKCDFHSRVMLKLHTHRKQL